MSLPGNGLLVVSGEAAFLVTALRRSARWGSHSFPTEEYDILLRMFRELQALLASVDDLRLLDPTTFLAPFLELVRSKETTGPVTSLALSSINKFLAYGLIVPTHSSVPAAVEDIADAVTHARFVGTDPASDGVVLMKMLQVLRTLMLSPEGAMLTDESVCEIMLSCFRISFETRLNELLRRHAEHCLRDMTQLIFMRLPQFSAEDTGGAGGGTLGISLRRKDKASKRGRAAAAAGTNSLERGSTVGAPASPVSSKELPDNNLPNAATTIFPGHLGKNKNISEAEITIEPSIDNVRSPSKKHTRNSSMDLASNGNTSITQLLEKCVNHSESDAETIKSSEEENKKNKEDVTGTENETTEIQPLIDGANEIPHETENKIDNEAVYEQTVSKEESQVSDKLEEYVNPRGIRFTQHEETPNLQPYGLNCVRELFRFLISLCNPLDAQNTSAMVQLGLCLVGTALEVGADQLAGYPSLLALVRESLSRNLLSLLGSERITIFALDLQISFLLFESMRHHLKLQMESFFKRLIDIISSDVTKAAYEMKEITHLALESLAQMFRIPGLCTELYLNYDCDIYCTNLFEDLTKLLSKHAVSSTAYNTHTLSLDALMTIIEAIEATCNQRLMSQNVKAVEERAAASEAEGLGRGGQVSLELGGLDDSSVVSDHVAHDISQYMAEVRIGRHAAVSEVPSEAEIDNIKNRKRWIAMGTELFNKKPEKGVEFLQEHGILHTPLQPREVALFLRENPALDKKMIGDYICKRSSASEGEEDGEGEGGRGPGASVLSAFADSFEYTGLRIDQALRLYLEAFRLPGEAPLIFLVMEHFAERWHTCNGCPFANTDAAFRLAYAVIMLNMDQHNHNAKKLNVPMTVDDFVRNLRGCNGAGDFPLPMLQAVFASIQSEEIVMPAEHTGLVRENYLWKVLLRRGAGSRYLAAAPGALDDRLFDIAWGPTVAALSSAFERASAPPAEELSAGGGGGGAAARALSGLERCAGIVACRGAGAAAAGAAGRAEDVTLDTLVLTMCKFTGLLAVPENASYISIGVALGQSTKGQLALRRVFSVVARHADFVRESWRNVLEIVRTLYIGRLLPKNLIEAEDLIAESGKVSLVREPAGGARAADAGLLSSLYSYIALAGDAAGGRAPSAAERASIDVALDCVARCNLTGALLTETKFLRADSLQELVRQLVAAGAPPEVESLQLNPQLEDVMVFFLELLAKITVQNRDRVLHIWPSVSAHLTCVLAWGAARDGGTGAGAGYAASRAVTALLRTAVRLMRNEECAPTVLRSLQALLRLPYRVFYQQADRIACGMYELVKTSAQNVHSAEDWEAVLALLAGAGAGAWPDDGASTPGAGYCSASSRSEGSDDDSAAEPRAPPSDSEVSQSPHAYGWILVRGEAGGGAAEAWSSDADAVRLKPHRACALARCTEALALVVRDVAHVTPYNFPATVRTVRLFVQASFDGGNKCASKASERRSNRQAARRTRRHDDRSDEEEGAPDQYHMISIQLLDLMHTLHSRTAQIFRWWREEAGLPQHNHMQGDEEYDLWEVAWMPLLQGIARFCTDNRKKVATSAIAYLQRALLAPGLQALGAAGWESCCRRVLFPLLERLMSRLPRHTEVAARADTVLCKVFLHHLSALSSRPTFSALWLRVVALQLELAAPAAASAAAAASPAAADDALREAALESLKNMILVMDSVKIFSNTEGYTELWHATWQNISLALPGLKDELFPHLAGEKLPASPPPRVSPPAAPSAPAVRNPLYLPPGPQSSVLLQPLTQMVSTPIGIAIPTQTQMQQGFPILYPRRSPPSQPPAPPGTYRHILDPTRSPHGFTLVGCAGPEPASSPPPPPPPPPLATQPYVHREPATPSAVSDLVPRSADSALPESIPLMNVMRVSNVAIDIGDEVQSPAEHSQPQDRAAEQSELYAEYLTNPYHDASELSPREPTLYEPAKRNDDRQRQSATDETSQRNAYIASLLEKKSLSVNCSPMHRTDKMLNTQFISSDNVQHVGSESVAFDLSSYFVRGGAAAPPGSEILFGDSFVPSEG